jgi:superoxide reductase
MFSVSVTVGKGIPHPNKTDHHISWVDIYFHSAAEKFPYQIARAEFAAHEASVQGADTGSVYTQPEVTVNFKTDKSGVIYAASYCNIHGIWQNSKDVAVE